MGQRRVEFLGGGGGGVPRPVRAQARGAGQVPMPGLGDAVEDVPEGQGVQVAAQGFQEAEVPRVHAPDHLLGPGGELALGVALHQAEAQQGAVQDQQLPDQLEEGRERLGNLRRFSSPSPCSFTVAKSGLFSVVSVIIVLEIGLSFFFSWLIVL